VSLAAVKRELREIPLGLIDAPELPSRATMDEHKLDELVASIRANGLLQPMSVARVGDRYEVVAGHRRWLACGRAGVVAVPCVVYPSKESALEAIKYAENRHREDLNPAEEAIWFNELLERDCGGDVDRLCEQLHEKRSYVEGRLNLLAGDEKIFQALQDGKIKIGVAHQLNRCKVEQYRRYLLHQAIIGGATVAVVSGWIQDWENAERAASGAPAPSSDAAPPSAIPQTDYFRCGVCLGTDNVYLMVPVNIHQHCKLAIFDKLMASYRGEA